MKSYKLIEEALNINLKSEEYIFKCEDKKNEYIISNIKDLRKFICKNKCNVYQYIDIDKEIKIYFKIVLSDINENFEEILNYNIDKLGFDINDLIIYQEDELNYVIIHKYYYVDNMDELNIYLLRFNLIKIRIITDKFINIILNKNIIIYEKYKLEETIINNISNLIRKDNIIKLEIIEKNGRYIDNIEFNENDTIFIKSEMGSGKSTGVVNYIKNNDVKSFLIISCRRTLTYSIYEKLKENMIDVKNYLNISKDKIKLCNKLIISPDSLYKIDYPLKKFDLIWIDECVSCMNYLGNYLLEENKEIIIILEWILKNAIKMILTDADLDMNIIKYYLFYRKEINSVLLNYKNNKEKYKYILFDLKEEIDNELKNDIKENNKLYICCDTLRMSKNIYNYVKELELIREEEILLYNSESDKKYEKEMYCVNNFWSKYKIVIVSPKVIFGVDFNIKYFDIIYCYYNCNTITVRECIQQIGRIRNLKKEEIKMYINNSIKKELDDNIINIKYDIENNIRNVFYKKKINEIKSIIELLKYNINKEGYKIIDINKDINYLIIYCLYEKNVNLNHYMKILKNKLNMK